MTDVVATALLVGHPRVSPFLAEVPECRVSVMMDTFGQWVVYVRSENVWASYAISPSVECGADPIDGVVFAVRMAIEKLRGRQQ